MISIGSSKEKNCCYLFLRHIPLCNPMNYNLQVPLGMGFSRRECRSELPFPSPGNLPNPGLKPVSPALTGELFFAKPPGKPKEQNSSK